LITLLNNSLEKNVPRLRFPGFEGEWETVKLSDFVERVTRKNTNSQSDLPLTISSKDGLVDQISYFSKTVASKDMSGYYLLLNGEFAYNKSYSVGYDYGSIKRLDRYPMGALSTLYICFALKKYDSDFIKIYFDSLKWYREIYMIAAEGARNHGLLNIPTDEFFKTRHTLPMNIEEQKKIASFLTLLDERISKQRELVESLKSYKRGVLNLIFNRKMSFCNYVNSNWKYYKMSDLFVPIIDKNHPNDVVLTIVQEIGTVPRDSIYRHISYNKDSVSSYKRVEKGDFILHLRSFEGGLEVANENGIVSPAYTILRSKVPVSTSFYYAYFHSFEFIERKLRISVEGIRDGKSINMQTFWDITVPFPSFEEQEKISALLIALDTKSSIETRALDSLVIQKHALLSKLFI